MKLLDALKLQFRVAVEKNIFAAPNRMQQNQITFAQEIENNSKTEP